MIGVALVVGFVFLSTAIRVVPEYQRLVILRLGRPLEKPGGPGIVFLIPTIDRAIKVDLREQVREVTNQTARTKDSQPVLIDYLWDFKVINPIDSVLKVGNFESAAVGVGATILRAVIGEMNVRDLSSEHEQINKLLRARLDEVTERWGVKVTNTEIRKIVVNDQQVEIDKAKLSIGTFGETQTAVHTNGTVLIGDQAWDAISDFPIALKSKVRVKRVVLEVEEDTSA